MARQQNTFEKMRREMEKKRKANEKRAKKQEKRADDSDAAPSTPAEERQAVRRLTDAEIMRMARNA
jgi:hypothetical protein